MQQERSAAVEREMSVGVGDRIVVVGLMASGKSTVGSALAARLHRPYLDNDTMLAERTGRTLAEFSAMSIEVLHAAERETFDALLRVPPPWVASAAASLVLASANVTRLRASGVCTVWLRARPETLAARAGSGSGRPLLEHPLQAFRAMTAERDPAFAAIADVTIDVDDLDVEAIVDQIIAALSKR
jgi:shikimate kinase